MSSQYPSIPIFVKYLLSVGSEVLHKLDSFIGCITAWLGFGAVHVCPTRLGAAGWVTSRSVEALIHRAIVAIVKASFPTSMVIAHGQIVWAVLSSIFIAAGWMSVYITVEVWFVCANPTSKWRSWGGDRIVRLDVQRVARFTLLGLSGHHLPASSIVCIHVGETLAVLIAQCTCFIKALTGRLLTIVFKAYKSVGRWAIIASSSLVGTNSNHASRGASATLHINGRILSYNGTILELLSIRTDTDRVILLTRKYIRVSLVIHPRDVVRVCSRGVAAHGRVGRRSGCCVGKSEGGDDDLHVF